MKTDINYVCETIIFETVNDAIDTLNYLKEIVENYGYATVSDLYDLAGLKTTYLNNKYGWMDLQNAEVLGTRHGYKIEMPRALPLKS